MSLTNTILILTNVPIVLVAIYAGFRYGKYEKEFRLFSAFLFLSALVQVISAILALNKINNLPVLHIYTAIGGFILIQFYYLLFERYLVGNILKWVAWLYLIFSIINSLFLEKLFGFNTNGLTVEAIIIIILSLSAFNLLINEREEFSETVSVKGITWINSGLFIYFSSNLLLYFFGDYLIESSMTFSSFRELWMLHSLFTIVMYCCFFIGLWKNQVK